MGGCAPSKEIAMKKQALYPPAPEPGTAPPTAPISSAAEPSSTFRPHKRPATGDVLELCPTHKSYPFIMFCGTCEKLLCVKCITVHNETGCRGHVADIPKYAASRLVPWYEMRLQELEKRKSQVDAGTKQFGDSLPEIVKKLGTLKEKTERLLAGINDAMTALAGNINIQKDTQYEGTKAVLQQQQRDLKAAIEGDNIAYLIHALYVVEPADLPAVGEKEKKLVDEANSSANILAAVKEFDKLTGCLKELTKICQKMQGVEGQAPQYANELENKLQETGNRLQESNARFVPEASVAARDSRIVPSPDREKAKDSLQMSWKAPPSYVDNLYFYFFSCKVNGGKTLCRYNTVNRTVSQTVTVPQSTSVVQIGKQVFLSGGYPATRAVSEFMESSQKLIARAPMNHARCYHAWVASSFTHIATVGGCDDKNFMAHCEEYSVLDDKWTMLPALNKARGYTAAALVENSYLYAIGGNSGNDTIEMLDMSKHKAWVVVRVSNRDEVSIGGIPAAVPLSYDEILILSANSADTGVYNAREGMIKKKGYTIQPDVYYCNSVCPMDGNTYVMGLQHGHLYVYKSSDRKFEEIKYFEREDQAGF